jgi:hypothetical protein
MREVFDIPLQDEYASVWFSRSGKYLVSLHGTKHEIYVLDAITHEKILHLQDLDGLLISKEAATVDLRDNYLFVTVKNEVRAYEIHTGNIAACIALDKAATRIDCSADASHIVAGNPQGEYYAFSLENTLLKTQGEAAAETELEIPAKFGKTKTRTSPKIHIHLGRVR